MPFSFPASPAVGATSTQNGREYRYAGNNTWELVAASGGGGLSWSAVPAFPTATGTAGQIAYDDASGFFYIATNTNTWKRAALSTWTAYRVVDSFTDTDGTAIASHAPDTKPTGASWAFTGVASDSNAGNLVIQSNRITNTVYPGIDQENKGIAIINAGVSDATVSATVSFGSASELYAMLMIYLRYADSGNYMRLDIMRDGFSTFESGFTLRWVQFSGGSATVINTTGTGTDLSRDTEYAVSAAVSGSSYTATLGSLSLSCTSSVAATAQSFGFGVSNTRNRGTGSSSYIDNFEVI
jgi:hypothetical protein